MSEAWESGYCEGAKDARKELEAELAALREQLTKFQESEFHPDWSMLEATRESLREHMGMNKALANENERLREQLAAAQKDAERYRWLKRKHQSLQADWHVRNQYSDPVGFYLDAAIDAAMKEKAE